jgi:PKD repeat protein
MNFIITHLKVNVEMCALENQLRFIRMRVEDTSGSLNTDFAVVIHWKRKGKLILKRFRSAILCSLIFLLVVTSPILSSLAHDGESHDDHLNDPTDDFSNDYAPMVIPVSDKSVAIAPVITCTNFEDDVWKPNHNQCKLAKTLFVDDDWGNKDARYTYLFEDWIDYDWNDIVVSLYAVTNDIITVEIRLEDREAAWKNPFSVEITSETLNVDVHWNSTDYPADHNVRMNPNETVNIELFAESNQGDIAFITIVPIIPPEASFVYSPLYPQVCENVTFNASASTPNGGYIVSYEWDFGDGGFHTFGVIVTYHFSAIGTYNVILNVTDIEGNWDTESKMVTVKPRTYTLTIISTSGGTTNPPPGNYQHPQGTDVVVTAVPDSGYTFDYWELDDVNMGSLTSIPFSMNKNHTLHAIFKEIPFPPPPVGGHATPIDMPHLLAPRTGLTPKIGLAPVLLAAVALTIILIRRRYKTLKQQH